MSNLTLSLTQLLVSSLYMTLSPQVVDPPGLPAPGGSDRSSAPLGAGGELLEEEGGGAVCLEE